MMAAEEGRRRGLGRGLSALLGDEPADAAAAAPSGQGKASSTLPVEYMHPSPFQPRKRFDDEAFAALVGSVREKGVLQPILVRPDPADRSRFEIVAGERRWRAAQQAQIHEVPVVVREMSDRETLEVALVENLQREDLTPLEEAEAYRRLMDEFGHTQEVLAQAVGKSRSHVANMIRLLGLPEGVRRMLDEGLLSAGHARTLVNAEKPELLAREIVRRGLNVRQAEDFTRREKAPEKTPARADAAKPAPAAQDPNVSALERDLEDRIGLKVKVASRSGGSGCLSIYYDSPEQLDAVLKRLGHD